MPNTWFQNLTLRPEDIYARRPNTPEPEGLPLKRAPNDNTPPPQPISRQGVIDE